MPLAVLVLLPVVGWPSWLFPGRGLRLAVTVECTIAYPHNQAIANHLAVERSVVINFGEFVEGHNKMFGAFAVC